MSKEKLITMLELKRYRDSFPDHEFDIRLTLKETSRDQSIIRVIFRKFLH